ncbi:MAG: peptidyl-prolyl cis-trans isomerase [Chthonomonadaceae bacterium]|nr:peptidyl-prolyl cis-trans isomerase [Chthonomonadaceae bacterium]
MRKVFIILGALSAVCHAQTPMDKTMIVVNGQSIDAKTYFKRMEVMPGVGKLVNDKFVVATPGYLAMDKLITETLLLQVAKEKGVSPTDAEVDAAIKERTAESPGLVEGLAKIGFTLDDLKYDTKVQLAEFKLQTMGINITDFEVEKFYAENKGTYTLPKRYKLSVIAVDTDSKKRAVDEALNSGKTFASVARDMSMDVTKANNGALGEVPEFTLTGGTQTAVKAAKKGEVTEWLSNGELSVKFYVEDILDAKVVPLDATLKSSIRRNLLLDRGRVKNDLNKLMADARSKASIEFKGTIFDDQLKKSYGKG